MHCMLVDNSDIRAVTPSNGVVANCYMMKTGELNGLDTPGIEKEIDEHVQNAKLQVEK